MASPETWSRGLVTDCKSHVLVSLPDSCSPQRQHEAQASLAHSKNNLISLWTPELNRLYSGLGLLTQKHTEKAF